LEGSGSFQLSALRLPIAPVREWGDDESRRVAQVLVPVLEVRRDHFDVNNGPFHVVPELADPVEVIYGTHLRNVQALNHVSGYEIEK
jgi:hypothetical protein